jgi:hypothetical protein
MIAIITAPTPMRRITSKLLHTLWEAWTSRHWRWEREPWQIWDPLQ